MPRPTDFSVLAAEIEALEARLLPQPAPEIPAEEARAGFAALLHLHPEDLAPDDDDDDYDEPDRLGTLAEHPLGIIIRALTDQMLNMAAEGARDAHDAFNRRCRALHRVMAMQERLWGSYATEPGLWRELRERQMQMPGGAEHYATRLRAFLAEMSRDRKALVMEDMLPDFQTVPGIEPTPASDVDPAAAAPRPVNAAKEGPPRLADGAPLVLPVLLAGPGFSDV